MDRECAEHPQGHVPGACPKCGEIITAKDTLWVNLNDGYPEDNHWILHCICYQCGEEWVE